MTAAPVFTSRPTSRSIAEGQNTSFAVLVSGLAPFSYTWRHNRAIVAGATGAELPLNTVTTGDAGYYEVTVTDSDGQSATSLVYLTVEIANPVVTAFGPFTGQVPSFSGGVRAIAEHNASVVLTTEGKVVLWYSDGLVSPLTAGIIDAIAVATKGSHGLALKSDGSIFQWFSPYDPSEAPPAGLTDVVAIASSDAGNLALKADGTVVGWGGQLSAVPTGLSNVVAIAASSYFAIALKSDGMVVGWGQNSFGEIDIPLDLADVVKVSTGRFHVLALKADGTVTAFGALSIFPNVIPPAALRDVTQISSGDFQNLALKSDGTVTAWGGNGTELVVPEGLGSVVSIACGDFASLALGRAVSPTIITNPSSETSIVGSYASMRVSVSGQVPMTYRWQKNGIDVANGAGISGAESSELVFDPVRAIDTGNYTVIVSNSSGIVTSAIATLSVLVPPTFTQRPLSRLAAMGTAITFTCAAADVGAISYQWRHRGQNIPGATGASMTISNVTWSDGGSYEVVVSNTNASRSSVFLLTVVPLPVTNATVVGWGTTGYSDQNAANPPLSLANITKVATGSIHALSVRTDGLVNAWGLNDFGAVAIPAGLTQVVDVAAGEYYSTALKADGTVVSWGSYAQYPAPVPTGLRDVAAISVGFTYNLALKTNGSVVSWGGPPVPDGLSNVTAVAAGHDFGLALKSDGTVIAWGENSFGQSTVPSGLLNVVAIAAGYSHSLAVKADGTVVAWGWNDDGQATAPVGLHNAVAVAAGTAHSIALRSDGTVVGWGQNDVGQSTGSSAMTSILNIAAGSRYNLGLTQIISPSITAQPSVQTAIAGRHVTFAVSAAGTGLSYQWRRAGVNLTNSDRITGANGRQLRIIGLTSEDAAAYDVVVSNTLGSVSSAVVALNINVPPIFIQRPLSQVSAVGQSVTFTAAVQNATGVTFQWRHNRKLIAGATAVSLILNSVSYDSAGYYELIATNSVASSSTVFSLAVGAEPGVATQVIGWGDGFSTATAIRDVTDVVGVAAGSGGTYLLTHDGRILTRNNGAIDLDGLSARPVALSMAGDRLLVLLANGTLGEVAAGSSSAIVVPPAQELYDVVQITAGGFENYALRSDGTVVRWPQGSTVTFGTITPWTNMVEIAAGNTHLLGLKSDGTVVGFGSDVDGETSIPAGLSKVIGIAAGSQFSVALKSDGTVAAWGSTAGERCSVPAGLTDVVAIVANFAHALARQADGGLVSWGTTFNTVKPVVPSLAHGATLLMDAGYYHDIAVVYKNVFPQTSAPTSRNVFTGSTVVFSVNATGGGLKYRWQKNGVNIDGATSASYTLTNVSASDVGSYTVIVTNNAGSVASANAVLTLVSSKALGDFNGDGKADLMWTNSTTGERSMWFLNGNATSSGASLGVIPVAWAVSATADFDGDGKGDVFLTNKVSGDRAMWVMNGSVILTNAFMGTVPVEWVISGTGDFNGDGKADVVWTNTATGDRAMWLMNGSTVLGGGYLGTVPVAWTISGVGDFNGDGKADLVWSNTVTGERSMWFQNGSTTIGGSTLNTVPAAWVINGVGDFNGDGKSDIFLTNTTTGDRVIWLMNGSTITTNAFMGTVPVDWTISGTGDFNADGKKDVFWTNTATGDRAMWLLNGSTVTGGGFMGTVPVIWTINN